MDRRDGYIMNEIMLRAENIERTYHAGSVDVPALKNCTLEFGQGEVLTSQIQEVLLLPERR